MTLMSVIVAFLFAISLWYLSSNHKVTFVKLKATDLKFLPDRSWHRLIPAGGTFVSAKGGTFQSDTPGTFVSAMRGTIDSAVPGTFESDTGGTFNPLLSNNRHERLTRGGITHILKKYVSMARRQNPEIIPDKISCHSIRHSKAMHLLQAGVNLIYIRDILGHVSIQTTEIYARADSKQKREAIEKAYKNVNPEVEPIWEKDRDLLSWLKSF